MAASPSPLRAVPWSGALSLLPGAVLYDGPGGAAGWHAHHALQVMVASDAPFVITTEGPGGDRVTRRLSTAVVPSRMPHRLDAPTDRMLLLLVEPSRARRVGTDTPLREGARQRAFRERMLSAGAPPALLLEVAIDHLAGGVGTGAASDGVSAPIRSAMRYLELHAPDAAASLAGAASAAHLSASRLTHRFTAEVGMPFRRYALWVRLRRAVEAVASGTTNLTDAAVAAGFSDGAHLSRAFRRHFGLPPSSLSRMRVAEADWPGRVSGDD